MAVWTVSYYSSPEAEFMNNFLEVGAKSWEFSDLRFPYTIFTLQTVSNHFCSRGMTVNSKEENKGEISFVLITSKNPDSGVLYCKVLCSAVFLNFMNKRSTVVLLTIKLFNIFCILVQHLHYFYRTFRAAIVRFTLLYNVCMYSEDCSLTSRQSHRRSGSCLTFFSSSPRNWFYCFYEQMMP
jgi:hypothetical protein